MLRLPSWPVPLVGRALVEFRTPHELALGVALGMAIGLVPKANLIAISLVLSLFLLRANLVTGLAMICLGSMLLSQMAPVTHRLGEALLSQAAAQRLYVALVEIPGMRWTGFNNTQVVGGLFLGLLQLYPSYCLSRWIADKARNLQFGRARVVRA